MNTGDANSLNSSHMMRQVFSNQQLVVSEFDRKIPINISRKDGKQMVHEIKNEKIFDLETNKIKSGIK